MKYKDHKFILHYSMEDREYFGWIGGHEEFTMRTKNLKKLRKQFRTWVDQIVERA